MMPQAQIRRIVVQAAAYELRVHAERDYVDEPTAQDVADRANQLLRETYLWNIMVDYDDLNVQDIFEILDIN